MNYQLPIITKCRVNGITLEFCNGPIPDIFRQLRFDPIIELELPDTKVRDVDKQGRFIDEFEKWLSLYRHATPWFEYQLLEDAQCN